MLGVPVLFSLGSPMAGIGSPPLGWLLIGIGTLWGAWALWTSDLVRVWRKRRKRGKRTENERPHERPQDLEVPPGATQQRFKLYEAACLLANVEPAWPLPNQLSLDRLDFLVDAVRVHDPYVKHVELRVVIPSYAMRPLDLTNFALRQHTYISQLRIRDAQQIARLRDVKLGITCKELDREALHNVAVDRKVLREYLESKSRPVPEFLHESHDRPDSDSERED